jgi:TatD DNase family protein
MFLNDQETATDLLSLIAECDRGAVATVTVTTTPKAWPRNGDMTAASCYVRAALRLHPQLVAEREGDIALSERHLSEARYFMLYRK